MCANGGDWPTRTALTFQILLPSLKNFGITGHNITQRRGSSKYNNRVLGARFESESSCVVFRASHCCIMEAPQLYSKGP